MCFRQDCLRRVAGEDDDGSEEISVYCRSATTGSFGRAKPDLSSAQHDWLRLKGSDDRSLPLAV